MTKVLAFDYLEQYAGIEQEIESAIKRVLKSGQLILGPEVQAFENEFAEWLGGGGYGVGVNSGTDALVVALMALDIGPGDEVITVANTAVPTVSAIRAVGSIPGFCEIDGDTCLMDIAELDACISERTRAIIPVHLYGNVVDVPAIRSVVANRDIKIIEDCAQSHGAKLGSLSTDAMAGTMTGTMTGTMGDVGAFSFYPTKNLGAYGDAGLCYTSDEALADKMRSIRMYGFKDRQYSQMSGVNSRLDELQAAILRVKLPGLHGYIERRRAIATQYSAILGSSIQPVQPSSSAHHAYHQFVVKLSQRDAVKESLARRGVATAIHYPWPIHTMSGFSDLNYKHGDLPVTESVANEILSLPMYPELKSAQVEQVCSAINQVVEELGGK